MDVKDWMRSCTIPTDHQSMHDYHVDEKGILEMVELKRGPWTAEEDLLLINYIANHGEGRWNSLALSSGLKRTGKSCRLRWLNYLRPDVRRGNITPQEQLLILQLHSRWGNRWSKIAQYLPGRTDNEIKNYWRTRVQKQAKQLRCDVNSKLFKDTMRYIWMPRLAEKIRAAAATTTTTTVEETSSGTTTTTFNINNSTADLIISSGQQQQQQQQGLPVDVAAGYINTIISYTSNTPEYSSTTTAASSDSFGTSQQDYNNYPLHQGMDDLSTQINYSNSFTSPSVGYFNQPKQGLLENHDFGSSSSSSSSSRHEEQQSDIIGWLGCGGEDNGWENFWNPEDVWFLHQQL